MTSLVIDVRPAKVSDAGDLADVHASAWREAYSGIIPALTLERMIVRRAAPGPDAARRTMLAAAEIQEIYLAPEYQGLGFGARLFGAALKVIRGKGYGRAVLRAIADNDRAIRFYERRGGRLFARSEEALGGKKLDCVWFEFPV